jgi:hypothetical protein
VRAAEAVSETLLWFWQVPFRPLRARPPASRRRAATVARLRHLVHEALGEGVEQEAAELLGRLSRSRATLERAVVVWVELVEALVQHVERRHAGESNLGALKALEVKAVMHHLLADRRLDLPRVPESFEPVAVDLLIEWTVDSVVLMANRYSLWVPGPAAEPERPGPVVRWLNRLRGLALRVYAWLYGRFGPRRPALPARLVPLVEAIRRDGFVFTLEELAHGGIGMVTWVGRHRRQVLACATLFFETVQQAEEYRHLSGPEKKAFAYDVVFAVLEDMGYVERAGLFFGFVDFLVSGGIEASVAIFNKRAWN